MNKARIEKVERIFFAALEIKTAEGRKGFLDHACQGDRELRAVVADMIALQPHLDKFFPEGGCEMSPAGDLADASIRSANP